MISMDERVGLAIFTGTSRAIFVAITLQFKILR